MHDKSAGFDRETGSQGPRRDSVSAPPVARSAVVSAFGEFLTGTQAARFLGVSDRRFAQIRHEAWMPLPVMLGERSLRWIKSELMEASKHRAPRCGVQAEPAQLAQARAQREVA